MNILRALVTGSAIGIALTFGVLAPAQAASTTPPTVTVVPMDAVTGASWSAPAYPVDCQRSTAQISCTPTDPAAVTAQQCFLEVLVAGERSTVCTTFEGHVTAIQSAGGTPLLVKYGCSIGDVVCLTFENAGRGLAIAATGMMFLVADNMHFDTSTLLWTAAVGEWSFWQWAILMVTFGAMVWAVAAAAVSGDREELVGALVRSFIAIPAVPITLWLTGHLLNAIDDMTWYVSTRGGPAGLFSTLQSVMWAGGQANYLFAFLIHGLITLGMFLLMLVFAFRNIALAALIMVGPVAWMLFPLRGVGPQWVVRYVSAVAVLLLTGPLTIAFMTLIINGLAQVKTIWDPQSWPLLVGLVLVAFAPFAIFGLFSFVGAVAADGIGSRLGSHAGRLGANTARGAMKIPTRFGGSPAGIGGRGPGPGPSGRGAPGGSPVQGPPGPAGNPSPPGDGQPAPRPPREPVGAPAGGKS